MDVNYETLESDLETGVFRQALEEELLAGFRSIHESGERLPPPSHYAARIAGLVSGGAAEPLSPGLAFNLYQEVLSACETASAAVLGAPPALPF